MRNNQLSSGALLVLVAYCCCSAIYPTDAAIRSSIVVRNRRPESCREQFPRRQEDLASVVLVAKVRELAPNQQRALVTISRLLKGPSHLTSGSSIVVDGLSDASVASQNCPNNVRPNDTLILLLELNTTTSSPITTYALQSATSGVFPMNLYNLERIAALANGEPYKRRPQIEDILCEAHYCAYGRCKVDDLNQTSCHCPESCQASLVSPVCGSDNSTYQNECQLIVEGCRLKRPLFVTKEVAC